LTDALPAACGSNIAESSFGRNVTLRLRGVCATTSQATRNRPVSRTLPENRVIVSSLLPRWISLSGLGLSAANSLEAGNAGDAGQENSHGSSRITIKTPRIDRARIDCPQRHLPEAETTK
jgi:hypothetical protein